MNDHIKISSKTESSEILKLLQSNEKRIQLMIDALRVRSVNTHDHNNNNNKKDNDDSDDEEEEEDDDTRFEKLKDRFSLLLLPPSKNSTVYKDYDLVNVIASSLLLEQCDVEKHAQKLSINLKVLSMLLSQPSIYQYYQTHHDETTRSTVDRLIRRMVVVYTRENEPLVCRTSVQLLFTIINHLNEDDENRVNIKNILSKRVCHHLQLEVAGPIGSDSDSMVDTKICILDLLILLLDSEMGCKFLESNQLLQLSCSLLFENNRLVRERVVDLFTLAIQSNDKKDNNNNGHSIILKNILNCKRALITLPNLYTMKQLFKTVIDKLLKSNQKELIATAIDLVSILESTFLFPFCNDHLFSLLDPITNIILNHQSLPQSDYLNSKYIYSELIIYGLIYSTKIILKRNEKYIFPEKWIDFIYRLCMSILPMGSLINITTKIQKEALDCLQFIDFNHLIKTIEAQPTPTEIISNLLTSTVKSQHRIIIKQSLSTIQSIIKFNDNNQLNLFNDSDFGISIFQSINRILMSPNSDVREVGLTFLVKLFKEDGKSFGKCLLDHGIASVVVKKLADSDSYVRSSALDVIKVLSTMSHEMWDKLTEEIKEDSIRIDQLSIVNDQLPTKSISDQLMNNNQINLIKYTTMIQKEQQQHLKLQPTYQPTYDHLSFAGGGSSVADSDERSLKENDDFEWDDEEFQELLAWTQEQEEVPSTNFMEESSNDLQMHDEKPPSYPFPYSILLFFSDQDLYPKLSSIELFSSWIKQEYSFDFINKLLHNQECNDKYQFNHLIYRLMNDSNWNIKLSTIKLLNQFLSIDNGLEGLFNIKGIELLIENVKDILEDKVNRLESIQCLANIETCLEKLKNSKNNQDYIEKITILLQSIDIGSIKSGRRYLIILLCQ
ncbi:hypothetical protein DFA_07421 [Cavenderia fasciculata]|uniref:Armadillo repeat-containing protein n=1 Tax=Cavenderia fasciculata TaxID=261658 RepID=F4PWD4_CACFS|nr:uncharacterized protein DFA_07421 [Cavenderia fasciculata]EGG20298.1 hypothetical protein DFA_07421 [Cavenderia fasciculata]|eukprot:XP_004367281.1 hypothetical protein DFA_07421 [Cavenderia fasciculata]